MRLGELSRISVLRTHRSWITLKVMALRARNRLGRLRPHPAFAGNIQSLIHDFLPILSDRIYLSDFFLHITKNTIYCTKDRMIALPEVVDAIIAAISQAKWSCDLIDK